MNQKLLAEYQRFVNQVQHGDRYTLFTYSEFGFPVTIHCTIENAFIKPYAQYDDALRIHYKPKRKRSVYEKVIYDSKTLYIWEGWIDIDDEMYASTETLENGTVTKMSLGCFDNQYIERALKSTDRKPDFIFDRDYYTNTNELDYVYQLVFADKTIQYNSYGELADNHEITGVGTSRSARVELQGQPTLKGLLGAMWGGYDDKGRAVIRYETQEVYNMLSN